MRAKQLRNLTDIRRFLARIVNEYDHGKCNAEKLRTISYALNILAGVIKDSGLEARVEALENKLQGQLEKQFQGQFKRKSNAA
ncbi:hypothetical protein [Desulfonatronovibrio hydrogenovorans]|uniref:hypothetical protein n=1 Tax=Desulfonatronovibrio hydrogenovorans TaxID=53245 RepID=UPI000491E128|nr:hypothetical protein [Desulfonatronovibrio hydrogenovorans]